MSEGYKVLIIGGGGREHALAWKCAQSPRVTEVLVAPGNAGTAREPKVRNVPVAAEQLEQLADLAMSEGVTLTIVGPEVPLVAGVVDVFKARGLPCFGPSKAAAQLEGSKVFTKEFLARHDIPTAGYRKFTRADFDEKWLARQRAPIVIKASGLAAGKGVVIAMTPAEAIEAARSMLDGRFGAAGDEIVVEEFLDGEEASFIVMCDGTHVLPMASSQDHKRLKDGDQGPNTGGMGAYSPAPVVTAAVHRTHHARGDRTHGARSRCRWHPVHRLPVCRADDQRAGRTQGHRIQRAFRRSGNPAGAVTAQLRHHRAV